MKGNLCRILFIKLFTQKTDKAIRKIHGLLSSLAHVYKESKIPRLKHKLQISDVVGQGF